MHRQTWRLLALSGLLLSMIGPLGAGALPAGQLESEEHEEARALQRELADAAREFGVPAPVLLGLSYQLSRWEQHAGRPSTSGGYGVMHLTDVRLELAHARGDGVARGDGLAAHQTLRQAAALLKLDPERLKRDRHHNIRGGAALLAHYARQRDGKLAAGLGGWHEALARYSGFAEQGAALAFADDVYATINRGVRRTTSAGELVELPAQRVTPERAAVEGHGLAQAASFEVDCPPELSCEVVPAAYALNNPNDNSDYGNYDLANRPVDGLDIHYIIIHDTEISYDLTLTVFKNPATYAATHYVIRSSDGHVAQMVENKNVAWHAGNWYFNGRSIGIEHEGVAIEGASWYTEALYRASARLVRYLGQKYGVPLDRTHIIGHDEIPGPQPANQPGMHWDPGPFWDWEHYMQLVLGEEGDLAATPTPGIVTISPRFAQNQPPLRYCYSQNDCQDVEPQPANFVYLRSAPDASAPYVTNPYFPNSDPLLASNWGNKALTGQRFYRVTTSGEWDGIYFGGELAWLHNPGHNSNTRPGSGLLVTPRRDLASIPVYGRAYPEAEAYPAVATPQPIVPIYSMPAGQVYVASQLVQSSYYHAPTYTLSLEQASHQPVLGETTYYQISFNHRFGFVKSEDVELISSPGALGLALEPATVVRSGEPGETISYTLQLTNTGTTSASFSISLTGALWPAQLDSTSLTLAPGERAQITLRVDVPEQPGTPALDMALIWVRRDDQPGRVALASRLTRVIAQTYLPLIAREV